MIPIQDVIPSQKIPVLTLGLLALAAIELLITLWLGISIGSGLFYGLVNMLFLWIFGDNVESRLGHGRFAALFVLCAGASSVVQTLTAPGSPLPIVVSSGAVAGVARAYFVLYPRSRVLTFFPLPLSLVEIPAIFFLGVFFALHLPSGTALVMEAISGCGVGALLCLALKKPIIW